MWSCRTVLGSGSFTDVGLPLFWIFRRNLDLVEWSSWGCGTLLAGISYCLQGDSDLGGREAKARLCGASPPWQPSGSCVSPIPEAQVLEERCPLVWALQGQDRVTGILLGCIPPRLPSWSVLRGQSTSFAAEFDVTRVLDQSTCFSFPPVPVPLMGRSDPSLYLLGESEWGGCGVVAWWGWGHLSAQGATRSAPLNLFSDF